MAHNVLEHMLFDGSVMPTKLPLSLLEAITNSFADDQEIGRGGFAVVYKGMVGNGVIAVKKLFETLDMDDKKFSKEIRCLLKVRHKNIVRFLGYCADTQGEMAEYEGKFVMADVRNRLLCFEYVPNGSLYEYISDASCGLEWRVRYQMIKGIYDNMEPKIADFGLSRCFDKNQSMAITSKLIGSVGYLAPEFYSGKITFKLDIYSLGIIILEILTGEKGYSKVEKILESWRNRLELSLEDPTLQEMQACAQIGLMCIDPNPENRPATQYIVQMLKELGSIEESAVVQEGHKPDCIVSPNLNVEGSLDQKASSLSPTHDGGASAWADRPAADQLSGSLSLAHFESGRRGPRSRGCYRCGKKGSFWGRGDKESCLVCGARYCTGCMLQAMGSMSEGRKCLECIGRPVPQSRWEWDAPGRGLCVLRQLLSAAEVELVMRSKLECAVYQLLAEHMYVNGAKLSPEELVMLQECPCPPSRLRPGFYWYDKVSGFWGKEGHKPNCIISPNLNVGGFLDQKASNGKTGILINGREITKSELQMLKLAGVQCAGKPHFWVNADGTYLEEGQKNVKGKIWDKPIVKLLSPVLSWPTPSKAANQCGEEAVQMVNRAIPDNLEQRTIHKLLIVGSGASTILKQVKYLFMDKPFTVDECEDLKLIIQSNIYNYLGILLEGRERFEEEASNDRRKISQCDPSSSGRDESGFCDGTTQYSLIPCLKAFSEWILNAMALGNLEDIFPAASRKYAPLVEELWKDPAIQVTYKRRNELPFLPPAANYFLNKAVDISQPEYELSDMDILYADGITPSDGLASTEFSFPQLPFDAQGMDEPDPQDALLRYQLIRINNRGLHENCKWLQMFDDVRLVIFCVAASDYDEYYEDANGTIVNKMIESRQLFESIVLHPTFEQMDFLLVFTKFDLLDQKIDKSPLTSCDWFDDFTPLLSRNLMNGSSSHSGATLSQMAVHYMGVKFKRLFRLLTERKLYVSHVNALDQASVLSVIRYGREIVKWEEEKPVFGASETTYSEEPSSYLADV
ncbi:hypothetical protein EJB05_00653 [Eragrostis curvula]|uniref:Protein kinase domain-containing protein n=1 Tax=Eragrostis curvula TaxID=38414 RepID=A0A5J9WN27_9POAL|nr:hypothetical protein EJB05_00653 [Eragrostis curvula]